MRKAFHLIIFMIRALAQETTAWNNDVWVIDSTPVECGRSATPSSLRTWPDGPSTATAPAQWTCSGSSNQRWNVVRSGSGWALVSVNSGIGHHRGQLPNSASLAPNTGSVLQIWTFTKIG